MATMATVAMVAGRVKAIKRNVTQLLDGSLQAGWHTEIGTQPHITTYFESTSCGSFVLAMIQ